MPLDNRRKRRASCLLADHREDQAGPVTPQSSPAPAGVTTFVILPTATYESPLVAATAPTPEHQTHAVNNPVEQQPQRKIRGWVSRFITPIYKFICRKINSDSIETVTPTPGAEPRVKRRKVEDATFTVGWASISSTRIGTEYVEKILKYIEYFKARADKRAVVIAHYNFPGSIEAFSGDRAYSRAFEISEKVVPYVEGYEAADAILSELFKPGSEFLKPCDIIHGDHPDTDHVLSADVHDWMIYRHNENTWDNFLRSKTEFAARLNQAVKSIMFLYSEPSFQKLKRETGHPLDSYDLDNQERKEHGEAADFFEFLGRKIEKSRILRELIQVPADTLLSVAADCRALAETQPVPSHTVFEPLLLGDRRDATGAPHSFGRRPGPDPPQSWTIHMPADRMAGFDENPTVALRDKHLRDHRRTFAPSPLVPLHLLPLPLPHNNRPSRPLLNVNLNLQQPDQRPYSNRPWPPALGLGRPLPPNPGGRLQVNRPLNLNQPYSLHRPRLNFPRRPLDLEEQFRAHHPPPHVNPLRRLEIKRPYNGRRPGILKKRVAPPTFGPPFLHHNRRIEGRPRYHFEEPQPRHNPSQPQEVDFFTGQPINAAGPTNRAPDTPRPLVKRPNTPRPNAPRPAANASTATDFNWQGHFAVPEDSDSDSDSEPSAAAQTPTRTAPPPVRQPLSSTPAQAAPDDQSAFNLAGHFAVPEDCDDESTTDHIQADHIEDHRRTELDHIEPDHVEPDRIEVDEPQIQQPQQTPTPITFQTDVVSESPVRFAEEAFFQSQVSQPPVMSGISHTMDLTPVGALATVATPHSNIKNAQQSGRISVLNTSTPILPTSLASDPTTRKCIKSKSRYISSLGRGPTSRLIAVPATPRPVRRKCSAIRAALHVKISPMPGSFPETDMEIDEKEAIESPQRPPFRQPAITGIDSHTTTTATTSVVEESLDSEKTKKEEPPPLQSPQSGGGMAMSAEERRQDLLDFFEKDYSKDMDPNGFLLESYLPSRAPPKPDAGKLPHSSAHSDSSYTSSSSASSSRSASPVRQSSESELQPSFGRLKISSFKNHQFALEAQIEAELEQQAVREEKERIAREAEEERQRREAEEAERRRQEEQAVLARTGGLRLPRAPLIAGISSEWHDRILQTLEARDTQVLGKSGEGNDITGHDLRTVVEPTTWLNDEIVNGSLSYLAKFINERAGIKDVRSQTPKCVFLNSHFFARVSQHGPGSTERWMRKAGIRQENFLKTDIMIIPINCEQVHWTLAIVRPIKGEVAHIDSLGRLGAGSKHIADTLMEWVRVFLGKKYYEESHWKTRDFVSPVQTNTYDCGVHTITTGMCLALGIDPLSYQASQMSLQRLRIAGVLMNRGYHGDFDLSHI